MPTNDCGRLLAAVRDLRAFCRRANMPEWDERLGGIEPLLVDAARRTEGLVRLEQGFAGMGSLNDIFICAENGNVPPGQSPHAANKEIARLLDTVFRELRLVGAPIVARLIRRWCEWRHGRHAAPRINEAFGGPRA